MRGKISLSQELGFRVTKLTVEMASRGIPGVDR